MTRTQTSRREFLGTAGAALAVPWFIPATSLGSGSRVAPSERIVMGAIACGGKGRHNTGEFLRDPRVQFVAVCDVDAAHRKKGVEEVNSHYGNEDCAAFEDLRELLARPDIDAVHVSTPDHWHAVASVLAMQAGKDVYCEKPLANSVGEGAVIRDTAARTGRVVQCGSQERSNPLCRLAAELVRSGRIGQPHTVHIQMPCDEEHHRRARETRTPEPQPVPEGLNWELWQGPTGPTAWYPQRCHFWWRFILDYGGGEMTDRGAHIIDIAQLALDMDHSGPVELTASGLQIPGSPYDAFWDFRFENRYANGVRLVGTSDGPRGLKIEGDDGWLFVGIHGGALSASRPEILPERVRSGEPLAPDEPAPAELSVQLGRTASHHANFLDCVISREAPFATAEIGHRTATICHLNNIAMRTGRPIRWDPEREELINDPQAGSLLLPEMRPPWTI
jgi:predicted dehydrogenase